MSLTQLREKALEVFGKGNFDEFYEEDPFNPGNKVSGFISRCSNEKYGALLIASVNGEECPQLIYGTPKMSYPFDKEGRWHFPSARKIEIYEKLDGTNILGFVYYDAKGQEYLSYKTRLRPFVNDSSKFGQFRKMWQEMLNKYPQIPNLVRMNNCNLSFELYGARNKHLIEYATPLDVALLFGVSKGGNIFSPSQLKIAGVPIAPLLGEISQDYVWSYQQIRQMLETKLQKTEDGYIGAEGAIWYCFLLSGKVVQFKCKPESIEQIHFAATGGMDFNSILATCWNAFENFDELTFENVSLLLREEYSETLILKNRARIEKAIQQVNEEAVFRNKVISEYQKFGKNILLEKREVMRHLSQFFPREKMGKVYAIIKESA